MSVTIKHILLDHQWKADGTNFVRIRITHNRKSKYIKTNILVDRKTDLGRTGKITNLTILNAIDDQVRKMRAIVAEINSFELQRMSVDQVVKRIEDGFKVPDKFVLDFVEYGYKIAAKKAAGTQKGYHVALNALIRFFNGKHPDISEITSKKLYAFEEYIKGEKVVKVNWRTGESKTIVKSKGKRAAGLYLSCIRHIYKSARKEFNEPESNLFPIPNDPFEYYSVPKAPASKHKNIKPEVIQLMINTRKELTGRIRMAVDTFLISFGLCGINAKDLYVCGKPKKKSVLCYQRSKTKERRDDGAWMWVKIHPCIKAIMKDYLGDDRGFDYSKRYASDEIFTTALNAGLRIWIKRYKQEDFTFGSARHSWASIGSSKLCKIDKRVITAGMCHVEEGNRVDDIYINFDWELLWDAQKKILDVFDWK